jgi:hypothetical protein
VIPKSAETVRRSTQLAAGVFALSGAYEGLILAGLETPGDRGYSAYHLICMALLFASSLWVFTQERRNAAAVPPIIGLVTVGLFFTGIGDFVNSSISPVETPHQKLTWSPLWFGLGYSAYVAFLVVEFTKIPAEMHKRAWAALAVAAPILLIANYLSWSSRIEPLVSQHGILKTGSLIFLATLYVALPALAAAVFVGSHGSSEALVLLIGAGLLPFSDLILFTTWLPEGEGPASLPKYALNWIFYFGGQALFFIGAISRCLTKSR